MTNHLELNKQLDRIFKLVDELRDHPYLHNPLASGARAVLGDIEQAAEQMRREIAGPRIVALYLADALEQVQRVTQLADEIELPPDPSQTRALGMACELAADKFRSWRELSQYAVTAPSIIDQEDGDELARAAA
jgi:hypothetical protein